MALGNGKKQSKPAMSNQTHLKSTMVVGNQLLELRGALPKPKTPKRPSNAAQALLQAPAALQVHGATTAALDVVHHHLTRSKTRALAFGCFLLGAKGNTAGKLGVAPKTGGFARIARGCVKIGQAPSS